MESQELEDKKRRIRCPLQWTNVININPYDLSKDETDFLIEFSDIVKQNLSHYSFNSNNDEMRMKMIQKIQKEFDFLMLKFHSLVKDSKMQKVKDRVIFCIEKILNCENDQCPYNHYSKCTFKQKIEFDTDSPKLNHLFNIIHHGRDIDGDFLMNHS